jgi:hypothetical protein
VQQELLLKDLLLGVRPHVDELALVELPKRILESNLLIKLQPQLTGKT